LSKRLKVLKGIRIPVVKSDCTHVYYDYPLLYDEEETGVPRDLIVKALQAEGVSVSGAYANLHLLPMYQRKIAYGTKGFPWSAEFYKGNVSYQKGICPVAEKLQDSRYIGIGLCLYRYTDEETDLIIQAFRKVWSNLKELDS
jgi:dTDP-4-amino-4,6-dideoxygalactose transaminase